VSGFLPLGLPFDMGEIGLVVGAGCSLAHAANANATAELRSTRVHSARRTVCALIEREPLQASRVIDRAEESSHVWNVVISVASGMRVPRA
jgi:hypothetical protein